MTQPTLSTYGGALREIGYAGELVDQNTSTIETRTNSASGAIDFGLAVARSGDKTCKVPAADSDVIIGISVRHAIRPANASGVVNYAQYDAVPVLRSGYIYATAYENAVPGDKVFSVTAQGGKLGSSTTVAAATAAAKSGGNAVNTGALTLDATTPVLAGAQNGIYTVRLVTAAANGGTFEVFDPAGDSLGLYVVGATWANQIKFAIADGTQDFIVGEGFDITVGAGRVQVPNATWETTTAAGAIGIVRIFG